jgi:hypothetical protein
MDAVCPHCNATVTFAKAIPQFCPRCGQTLPRDLPTTPTPTKPGADRTNPFIISVVVGAVYCFMALIVFGEDLSSFRVGQLAGFSLIATVVMGFVIREFRWGWLRAFCFYPFVFCALVVWGTRR